MGPLFPQHLDKINRESASNYILFKLKLHGLPSILTVSNKIKVWCNGLLGKTVSSTKRK